MKAADRDAEMTRFRDGELDVLVGTTVVEVGVDVPSATMMVIEGADRFGLAQLHQLRGRVGRGTVESFCVLVSDTTDEVAQARLKAVAELRDGFELAERDFELRREGDVLGLVQSGLPQLRVASLPATTTASWPSGARRARRDAARRSRAPWPRVTTRSAASSRRAGCAASRAAMPAATPTPMPSGRWRGLTPAGSSPGRPAGSAWPGPGEGTRPIGDRVKQTLFAILEPDLPGATVLDLFAGSGAAGIEALSRGRRARHVRRARPGRRRGHRRQPRADPPRRARTPGS